MDALIAVILMFLPVIVYVIRRREYETPVILMTGLGLFVGLTVAGWISWLLFGKQNMWIGYVGVWIYAMYVALKKID